MRDGLPAGRRCVGGIVLLARSVATVRNVEVGCAISEVCSFLGNCVTFSSVFELKMEDWMGPHPLGEGAKAEGRYRRTTQERIDCSSGVVSGAPHRTLPIIGLDLNNGLGMSQGLKQSSARVACRRKDGR